MSYTFINITTGDYPRHIGDIQLAHPEWDGNVNKLPDGWVGVTETQRPTAIDGQVVLEGTPELVNGEYRQIWVLRDMAEAEIADRELFRVRKKVQLGEPLTEAEAALLVGPSI